MSDIELDLAGGCFDDLSDVEVIAPNPKRSKQSADKLATEEVNVARSNEDCEDVFTPETGKRGQWNYDVIVSSRERAFGVSLREKINELYPNSIKVTPDNGDISQRQSRPDTSGSEREWGSLGLSKSLLRAVYDKLQFAEPSIVQESAIPVVLSRKDLLVTAETGSGKTASFLLPICELLLTSPSVRNRRISPQGSVSGGQSIIRCVILLPTRELAVQCQSMLTALTTFTAITSALVVGGSDSNEQISQLRRSPDFVLSTPGRLLDLVLNSPGVYLDRVDMVVLDEADRLLEIGFKDEITHILKHCSKQRQTLLFSATVSKELTGLLAAIDVKDPVLVEVSKSHQMVKGLRQEFCKIPDESFREAALLSLIGGGDASQTENAHRSIIFFKEKREAHRLAILLGLCGYHCFELHGDLPQKTRVSELSDFQQHTNCFLLATDLASRGLDLPQVNLVINYNLPQCDIETRYTHRVGRTARMGREGRAVTIYTGDEYKTIKKLVKVCVNEPGALFERKLSSGVLNKIKAMIGDKADVIKGIEKEEAAEREIMVAERDAEKIENLAKHKEFIKGKPAKIWIESANDKDKLERMRQGKVRTNDRRNKRESENPKRSEKKQSKDRKIGKPGQKDDRKQDRKFAGKSNDKKKGFSDKRKGFSENKQRSTDNKHRSSDKKGVKKTSSFKGQKFRK